MRVPHDEVMNAPLLDSWTIECWIKVEHMPPAPPSPPAKEGAASDEGEEDTLNLVGFHARHPTLAITRRGHAYTAVRDVEGLTFGYEGTTDLTSPGPYGRWHHIAATWNGREEDLEEQALSLYVDGKLEQAGGPHDDGSGEPKRPGMSGYNAPSECTENLCEEGMHIGGFYQSGGRVGHKGYTGHFFDGVIDEVRVWQRPRTVVEINMFMAVPLRPSDFTVPDKGLLFYFPFDERGMDSGQEMIVVESRAYPWFGLLGNSTGAGRPVWVESEAPLKCMVDSLARPCIEVGMGNTREENYAVAPGSATGVAALASGLKRRYSHGTMASAVLLTMLFSAAISVALTRAVLVDGLELSCSSGACASAGRALARAVRGSRGSRAAATSSPSPATPGPQTGGSGYATVA